MVKKYGPEPEPEDDAADAAATDEEDDEHPRVAPGKNADGADDDEELAQPAPEEPFVRGVRLIASRRRRVTRQRAQGIRRRGQGPDLLPLERPAAGVLRVLPRRRAASVEEPSTERRGDGVKVGPRRVDGIRVGPHRQRPNTTQTQDYDKTRPWIAEHCPHLLKGEDEAGDVGKKGKRGGGVIKKKTISADKQKVIISKEVRNKKKAVTSVEGLETFSVKLKDAAKVFGKKFAASSSVKEKDSGGQEIVIQGDVIWDLPALLEKEYKIPKSKIFEREKGGKLSKVR